MAIDDKRTVLPKDLDAVAEMLKDDSLRREVIDFLARDFSKDFLSPVRMNFGSVNEMPIVSCKEWQE